MVVKCLRKPPRSGLIPLEKNGRSPSSVIPNCFADCMGFTELLFDEDYQTIELTCLFPLNACCELVGADGGVAAYPIVVILRSLSRTRLVL